MRVIYDNGARPLPVPHTEAGRSGRTETVIIISSRRNREGASSGGPGASADGYELRLSDEAIARDREVRSHEKAHQAALGGAAASDIQYDTATGPGGESIAVGGRIAVDMAEVPGDPDATLRKARSIIAAAFAPGVSSGADLRTASQAYEMERKAADEVREKRNRAPEI